MIPRIRGKCGQAFEPEDVKGKWFFEIWIDELGKDSGLPSLGPYGPFETEEIAQKELRSAVKMACEMWEKDATGSVSGKYIDMKTNLTRPWDKSDEQ